MSMFEDIPVEVGVIYEGERIRWAQTYTELGGPRVKHKFELVQAKSLDEIEDGKITVIGPDIADMEKKSYPFGIYIEVAGKEIEEDLEGVIERHIHEYINFVEGMMHLNQRYDIHIRISEKTVKKGFNSFKLLGKVMEKLYKADRYLTTTAIQDAIDADGNEDDIDEAEELLDEADYYWDTGDYFLIADYVYDKLEESWEKAVGSY